MRIIACYHGISDVFLGHMCCIRIVLDLAIHKLVFRISGRKRDRDMTRFYRNMENQFMNGQI